MRSRILRVILFVVFFSIGAGGLTTAILFDDLLEYYRQRALLRTAEVSLERLESLNADYDILLGQVREDPEQLKRIAPATLGVKPADANAVYPKARAEQLAAARRALAQESSQTPGDIQLPEWVARLSRPVYRILLFLSGAFLILISFVCFGPAGRRAQAKQVLFKSQ